MLPVVLFLLNLPNACHALSSLPPGERRITVRSLVAGARIRLEVRDNGPGVNGDARGDGNGSGSGLGLTNTRARLQELYGAGHRFDLTNAPEPARGALATIEIPFSDHARGHR